MTQATERMGSGTPDNTVLGTLRRFVGRFIAFTRRTLAAFCWLLVATGLLLRMTVQDRYHPWAIICYLTPVAAIPLWLIIAQLLSGRRLSGRVPGLSLKLARLNQILILFFLLNAIHFEWMSLAKSPSSDDFKVVFWNTARIPFGIKGPAGEIAHQQAALVGLVEANAYSPDIVDRWRQALPDYQIAGTHFGGLIALKGTVLRQFAYDLLPNSSCEQFDVVIDGTELTVLLVDISSQLNLSRKNPLRELADLCERLKDRAVIVMGDFNTPDDSVHLDPLRAQCRNGMRTRGTGYAPSWPMPLPVLTLDQIWVNPKIRVTECRYRSSIKSDHRSAVFHVAIEPEQ